MPCSVQPNTYLKFQRSGIRISYFRPIFVENGEIKEVLDALFHIDYDLNTLFS